MRPGAEGQVVYGVKPVRDGDDPLRGPVLAAGAIGDLEQNAEAAGAGEGAVQLCPLCIGEAMLDGAALGAVPSPKSQV